MDDDFDCDGVLDTEDDDADDDAENKIASLSLENKKVLTELISSELTKHRILETEQVKQLRQQLQRFIVN